MSKTKCKSKKKMTKGAAQAAPVYFVCCGRPKRYTYEDLKKVIEITIEEIKRCAR